MGIKTNKQKDLSWNYYLVLVQELSVVSNYIEFEEENYSTYSIELVKLLIAASSEVDVVLKQLCRLLDKKRKCENIEDYRKIIKSSNIFKDFTSEKILISRQGLELHPWENWGDNKNPYWWKAYNNVKHKRDVYFSDATLKNVLNAIAALLVCISYLKATDEMLTNGRTFSDAISWGWGKLTPRNLFLRLDRIAYPLAPFE
jgi:hypothetical protein